MTLIELLSLLLICLVVGFAAHLIFPAWGWWLGATPAFTVMFVLAFFTFKNLFSSADENGHGNMVERMAMPRHETDQSAAKNHTR